MKMRLILGPILLAVVAFAMWLDWSMMGGAESPDVLTFFRQSIEVRPWGFIVLASVFLGVCAHEVMKIFDKCGMRSDRLAILLGGVALLAALVMRDAPTLTLGPNSTNEYGERIAKYLGSGTSALVAMVGAFILILTCSRNVWRKEVSEFPRNLAGTLATFLYVIVPGGMLIEIRRLGFFDSTNSPNTPTMDAHTGLWLVIWLVVVVRLGADTCAYFVGKSIGKKKLIPHVSPGKSVEGFLGGIAGATLLGWGAYVLMPGLANVFSTVEVLALGFAMGLIAPIGDLTASALKRGAGVKDSGKLLPEFGGSLDMIDGFMLAGPALYLFLIWKFTPFA